MRGSWREWREGLEGHRYLSVVAYSVAAFAGLAAVVVALGFVVWVIGLVIAALF